MTHPERSYSAKLGRSVRSAATDEALDGVLAALYQRGFSPPDVDPAENRDALASALVDAAVDHELRIRIDRKGRPTVRGVQLVCGRIMVGSGTDTYDPTCDLAEGHSGPCKSRSAIDQHRLVR